MFEKELPRKYIWNHKNYERKLLAKKSIDNFFNHFDSFSNS